jgi:hypothetical protein
VQLSADGNNITIAAQDTRYTFTVNTENNSFVATESNGDEV